MHCGKTGGHLPLNRNTCTNPVQSLAQGVAGVVPSQTTALRLRVRSVATLAQVATIPTGTVPVLGASGAIAAVMGGFWVTCPRDRIRSILLILVFVRSTYVPAAVLIGVWFVMQFLS